MPDVDPTTFDDSDHATTRRRTTEPAPTHTARFDGGALESGWVTCDDDDEDTP